MSGQKIIQGLKYTQQTVEVTEMVGGSIGMPKSEVEMSATYTFEHHVGGEVYVWTGVRPQLTKDPEMVTFQLHGQPKRDRKRAIIRPGLGRLRGGGDELSENGPKT